MGHRDTVLTEFLPAILVAMDRVNTWDTVAPPILVHLDMAVIPDQANTLWAMGIQVVLPMVHQAAEDTQNMVKFLLKQPC